MNTKYALVSFLAPLEHGCLSVPINIMGKYPKDTLFVAEIIDADSDVLERVLDISKMAFKRAIDKKGWPQTDKESEVA